MLIAQLQIPGDNGTSQSLAVPSGIPAELSGDLKTTGSAVFQLGFKVIFLLAIFLGIIFILTSGIQMVTSGGDSEKLAVARKRLIYSIIGLVLVAGAFLAVTTVFKSLGLSTTNLFKIQ